MKNKALPIPYKIRRSSRAKRTRIIVSAAKVEVVAPFEVLEKYIHEFVQAREGWIKYTKEKLLRQQRKVQSLAPDDYQEGAWIPFRGEKYQLTIRASKLKRFKVEFSNEFRVFVPDSVAEASISSGIQNALIRWMKIEAGSIAGNLVLQYAEQSKLRPRSIKIKHQQSRWGSCGIHDDINLNWLLILAPPRVFEYVVVHELSHIRYKNHAAEFWELVGDLMPDYKLHRLWLKRHGATLMMGL